jgi:hypothetical protein
MLRSSLIVAGAALLCGTSYAQGRLDPSMLRPTAGPPQYAGTYNVNTHRWVGSQRPMARSLPLPYAVYDNTCTWFLAGFYQPLGVCNDFIDEGRIPGGLFDTNAPFGATADNLINTVVFSYCVDNAVSAGVELDFFDGLGGGCLGGVPALPSGFGPPPPGFSPWVTVPGLAGAFTIPAGALPPDTLSPAGDGFATCWIVTVAFGNAGGFCMQSNADGIFDNASLTDNFNWVFQVTTPQPFPFDGELITGEPANIGGTCTYTIPCSADLYYTSTVVPCGHGLDTQDLLWINIDALNVNAGGPGPGCGPYGILGGSGCYWFGGHPGNPFCSFYLRLESLGSCAGCDGAVIDTCDPSAPDVTDGCTPDVSWVGTPDVAQCNTVGPSDFVVTFGAMSENKTGNIILGKTKPSPGFWSAQSSQCFAAPFTRTGQVDTGDTNGGALGCGGSLALDVEAYLQGGNPLVAPAAAGDCYVVQGWYRDPSSAKTTQMTDAAAFYICP